ncbi:hypothetical protein M0R72_10930 [Candidatus Pacearchaeota archaeon]|jgi:hypothetical protein|nr:hypothetical protein [Candidatus Pacearchaeota archaeon]
MTLTGEERSLLKKLCTSSVRVLEGEIPLQEADFPSYSVTSDEWNAGYDMVSIGAISVGSSTMRITTIGLLIARHLGIIE